MILAWTPSAWADYLWWQSQDRATLKRINRIIDDTLRHPFEGLAKPERLKGDLSGFWSRRITQEHRLVYAVDGKTLTIIAVRYHY
ncbi:Txe/YoeB family addiction module toxin [Magnetofaba australis]|uniref:Putative mRNA interferase YoeB n=1 Tax=Magnetofaba australis IT-1 TaxID=1434232 RepID=A0A1Y2K1L0_9PROT|nr:Txe/YoeB family addiction module toxin [Magnetofaba australis]OSM00072.1 putative Txe/YoeB family addiction module toxin [Magnetofaba australis IT-1]